MGVKIIDDEGIYLRELLERIVERCPRRASASDDERRAAAIVQSEFQSLGLDTRQEVFEFNKSLYATLALHFGLGSLGTVISPVLPQAALALHLLAGVSYYLDSTKRAHVLRGLLPKDESQNVVATLPAIGDPALRVVFLAHLDAAFTGRLFEPENVARMHRLAPPHPLSFLQRGLAVATYSQFVLAGFDLLRMGLGPLSWPLRPIEHLISVPSYLAFASNLDVVLRNRVVPGANDDLSGVVALPILAARLAATKPDEVELVFVATGAEEAGMGGAAALARAHASDWHRGRTVIIGIDGLSNGDLRLFAKEGEVVQHSAPKWLVDGAQRVAARDPRFEEVETFAIPVGGTDVGPFLMRGYDGMCIGCIDPALGAPRHYHLPEDTPANLDWDKLDLSIDFIEALAREVIDVRLGRQSSVGDPRTTIFA